ncbi:uncharacterized protein LOC119552715 [Drosophila subpulchrella]|uniref:uncharacterized protein LOC119552715 n=1 Tax=Drosophila subpulchrella TaxID=1486046 RepID=UPI0018A12A3C|nr:uncharacterized protein LOC119552715 [Drosophila subpulchrella]
MALADESNFAYVKQVALDWRELVRERRQSQIFSPTLSMLAEESQLRMAETKSRTQSMIPAERRDSSFYRHRFSLESKPLEIEQQEVGSMEPARIKVSENVHLFIYQPIPVSPSVRASIVPFSPSDPSITSTKLEEPVEEDAPAARVEPGVSPDPKSP